MKPDGKAGPGAVPWWLWIAWGVSLGLFFQVSGDLERRAHGC